jgi:hypothetical protein
MPLTLSMLLPLGMLLPPGHAGQFWACCSPRGMLVNSGNAGQFWACWSILGMLLSRGMLVNSGHAAPPGACWSLLGILLPPGLAAPPVERPPVRPIASKQVIFAHHHFTFPKKVTVWGGKISSQISIERLLILSPPSKRTLKQKKLIFLINFFFSRF